MKPKNILLPVNIFFIYVLFSSCEPFVTYPPEPQVSFKSANFFNYFDTLGNPLTRCILTIKVIDGDGDIGLNQTPDPLFEDLGNQNLFIRMNKKTLDGFIDGTLYSYRTPYLEPEGQDKSLVADFEIKMDFYPSDLPHDTIIKFSFYIFDRKKNKSNIGETPEFPSDTIGMIKP